MSLRDNSAFLLLDARSDVSAILHLYVAKKSRGKRMFEFIEECKQWVIDNTKFKYIFNYTTDHRVKFIMLKGGSKNLGIYKGHSVYKQVIRR